MTRQVGDDTLIVPLATRPEDLTQIFILNPVGAFVWKQLDGARRFDDLLRQVAEEFEGADRETMNQDLVDFLDKLESLGLLALSPPAPRTSVAQEA